MDKQLFKLNSHSKVGLQKRNLSDFAASGITFDGILNTFTPILSKGMQESTSHNEIIQKQIIENIPQMQFNLLQTPTKNEPRLNRNYETLQPSQLMRSISQTPIINAMLTTNVKIKNQSIVQQNSLQPIPLNRNCTTSFIKKPGQTPSSRELQKIFVQSQNSPNSHKSENE